MDNLGDILKETRQRRQLSQLETAENICSQSTLSEIEHNKYIPNTQLLINLCQRLSINFDDLLLAQNFNICKDRYFNQKVRSLYNSRNYQLLKTYLNRPTVIESVQTGKQTQAYYFYLAVCDLHLEHNFDSSKELLKLSLASAGHSRKQTTLTRICNITLAYVYAKQGLRRSANRQIELAQRDLNKITYDENLNIIYFVAALSYLALNKYNQAIEMVEKGINFTRQNNSHFMLLDSIYLMAHITEKIQTKYHKLESIKKYDIFNDFIHERPYAKVN
ncbi:helix-turn-helix domain-containing protein [Companilactobacillus paralimentarius]|jgi:Predicted transcriptional regulators|uniref:helix-turn-helix domain-containing protein n=1 Tax=Companilactobacillus paralimentarius TaxID=83526 RepID=UPI003850C628